MIKTILLIDDHSIVRSGLKSVLLQHDKDLLILESSSAKEALNILSSQRVDVAFLDYSLPDATGNTLISPILQLNQTCKIIIFSAFDQVEIISSCLSLGAHGYLLKATDSSKIVTALSTVQSDEIYIDAAVSSKLFCSTKNETVLSQLSESEKSILEYLSEGMSNKEIAAHCFMAEKTVRNYLSKIFEKLEVKNRTEAAVLYRKLKSNT